MQYQAVWNGVVLARSGETVVVEGNRYFPQDSLDPTYFEPSSTRTLCPWKGLASYYTVNVDGVLNHDAAWYYPKPWILARRVKGKVAFWNGVEVVADPAAPAESPGEPARA